MRVPLGKGQKLNLPIRVFASADLGGDEAPEEFRVDGIDLDADCVWIYVSPPARSQRDAGYVELCNGCELKEPDAYHFVFNGERKHFVRT